MILQAKTNQLTQGDITEQYAEVYIHLKDKGNSSFIKANKVILAFNSPYFHKIFQSRDNMQTVDFAFIGIGADVIRETISMIYGSTLNVSKNEIAKFKMFFKMLEMDICLSEDVDNPAHTNKQPSTVECEPADMDTSNEMSIPSHGNCSPRRKKALQTTSCHEDKTTIKTAEQPTATKQTHLQSTRKAFDSPATQPSDTITQLPGPSNLGTPRTTTDKETSDASKETNQSKESRPSSSDYNTTGHNIGPSWYTTRGGAPASLNNWTETTEDGLQDRLTEIDFKIGLTSEGHHKDYICCNCEKIFKAFSLASNHFEEVHKKCDEEMSLLREAMEYRKVAVEDIGKLQTQIAEGCIKELADNQLR